MSENHYSTEPSFTFYLKVTNPSENVVDGMFMNNRKSSYIAFLSTGVT